MPEQLFGSRSAATRRIDQMVEEGLVRRKRSEADGRGVVIALTEADTARLVAAVPVHLDGVSRIFIKRLEDDELEILERVLEQVSRDCTFR
jgi:DNA-binding MarR family transcriptional regulator